MGRAGGDWLAPGEGVSTSVHHAHTASHTRPRLQARGMTYHQYLPQTPGHSEAIITGCQQLHQPWSPLHYDTRLRRKPLPYEANVDLVAL